MALQEPASSALPPLPYLKRETIEKLLKKSNCMEGHCFSCLRHSLVGYVGEAPEAEAEVLFFQRVILTSKHGATVN